jgi:flagellar FliJ protein
MRWADQLIKLSNFELELLQARLADVVNRRQAAEVKLAILVAEGESELALARLDPESGWRLSAFTEGLKQRKAAVQRDIDTALAEEEGARDAIAEAFETLKKYEQVAETARVAQRRVEARRETAALDEVGLRRAVAGRR